MDCFGGELSYSFPSNKGDFPLLTQLNGYQEGWCLRHLIENYINDQNEKKTNHNTTIPAL
jgi:hypothetical protein